MRMMIPGLRERRAVDAHLTDFFRTHRQFPFRRAMAAMSRFYELPTPRVEWFQWLDWGKSVGRTYVDAGANEIILNLRPPFDRDLLREFAKEIIPAFN